MRKFLTLFCAAALVVAFAGTAAAEVQSIKVSGDIQTLGIYRDDYDLNDSATGSNDDDRGFVQSAVRVRVDADLTDNVGTTVRLLNERNWGGDNSASTAVSQAQLETEGLSTNHDTDIDLDLASLTLKDFLYSPLTVTVGRQEIRWGNGFLLGDPDSNDDSEHTLIAPEYSRRKSFDALRATLDFDPIMVDSFLAHLSEGASGTNNDRDLWGAEASYAFSERSANVAAYILAEHNLAVDTASSTATGWVGGSQEADTNTEVLGRKVVTVGLRGDIEPTTGLNLTAEGAIQSGDLSPSRDLGGQAFQAGASYALDHEWKPSLRANFAFFSGEEQANADNQSDDYDGWVANFEDQTWGIIADQLNRSIVSGDDTAGPAASSSGQSSDTNMVIFNLGASMSPIEDVTVGVDFYSFTLAEENDTADATNDVFTNEDDYGNEFDFTATYDYTEDVTFGSTLAFFVPGNAFETDAQDTAIQGVGSVEVVF